MSKYEPLSRLHKLVQLTHSANGKAIFYSQVNLAMNDSVDEDEAGGWILSAFTGKSYFEREYRRDDLDDLLTAAGDSSWDEFANRFRTAIIEGYFHLVDSNPRECTVIIDNNVQSREANSTNKLTTIAVEMYPVNHASRGEKLGEFMFECASYIQAHGCSISSNHTTVGATTSSGSRSNSGASTDEPITGGKSYEALKTERDTFKSENATLRLEIERLRANQLASQSSSGGLTATGGRSKSKNGQLALLNNANLMRKRKGVSYLNPRVKKPVIAQGTVFDSDDDDDDGDDEEV
ncbi:hypothetical protein CPC16_005366 [Podila verticillata]|nr:hypothetical protein CPC16_005366 [Podila verticillata]